MSSETQRFQDRAARLRRLRIGAAQLFQKVCSQAEVSRSLAVSRRTASLWQTASKPGGRVALVGAERAQWKSRSSGDDLCHPARSASAGATGWGYQTELWTLKQMAQLIEREFVFTSHASHVWKRPGQLGWSCPRPECEARERNEESIQRWVQYRWPHIKKLCRRRKPSRPINSTYAVSLAAHQISRTCGYNPGRSNYHRSWNT